MSSSKDKVKGPGKSWAKISNEEDICERDPNGLFFICSVCGEVNMRNQFDSGRWFYHKVGQLHNQKKQNEISKNARLDKSVEAGTKRPATKQSSMLSIVILTKRTKEDSSTNVASLHKEDKLEGGEEYKYQAEPNYECSTSKISERLCEGILPEVISKASQE